jgi:hypothetical protein
MFQSQCASSSFSSVDASAVAIVRLLDCIGHNIDACESAPLQLKVFLQRLSRSEQAVGGVRKRYLAVLVKAFTITYIVSNGALG